MRKKTNPIVGVLKLGSPFLFTLTSAILASLFAVYQLSYGTNINYGLVACYVTMMLGITAVPLGFVWMLRLLDLASIEAYYQRNNVMSILNTKVDALFSKFCLTGGKRAVLAVALSRLKYRVHSPFALVEQTMQEKGERFNKASIFSKAWWKDTFTITRLL